MPDEIIVVNIREYLERKIDSDFGEDALMDILSEFSCERNLDVENFLKEKSIEFTKKQQSVTYLVFASADAALLGYFTLTLKPITVNTTLFSNSVKRKIARVSQIDEENGSATLSAYLIAQIGKNFTDNSNEKITGTQLLEAAVDTIKSAQYMLGGMVIFLEAEEEESLMEFYESRNGFKRFDIRKTYNEAGEQTYIQLLKVLK